MTEADHKLVNKTAGIIIRARIIIKQATTIIDELQSVMDEYMEEVSKDEPR